MGWSARAYQTTDVSAAVTAFAARAATWALIEHLDVLLSLISHGEHRHLGAERASKVTNDQR
jgi:hypothetical protein